MSSMSRKGFSSPSPARCHLLQPPLGSQKASGFLFPTKTQNPQDLASFTPQQSREEASCTRRGGHPALPGSAVRLVGGQHAEEMEKVGNAAISESE